MPDPYDVLTIAALGDELNATIGNGRVQRIGLADARTIGAEIYAGGQRHYLLASADDRRPRLRLASAMPSLDPALVTPFGLLLRKHVRGGVILGIDQPPLERLARLSIAKRQAPLKTDDPAFPGWQADDEDDAEPLPEEVEADLRFVTLVIELMGRHSNLILVDNDGRVMESAKRVTPAMSRVRTVLPRLPYAPPPPLDRHDPRTATGDEMVSMLGNATEDGELARALIATYRGVSPTIAREVVYRVLGDGEARVGNAGSGAAVALAHQLRAIMEPLGMGNWAPRVYREREEGGQGAVVAVSPVPISHLAARYDERAVASISEALAIAESGNTGDPAVPVRHAQRRARLLAAVAAARERAERRLAALAEQGARAKEADRWKRWGDLIYANQWQIAPGQTALEVEGERIPLDLDRSPSENAQGYFERYRKAQGASAQLPALEEATHAEIAYLDQLATLIAQAPGFAALEALAAEWNEGRTDEPGARPKRKSAPKRPQPLRDAAGNMVYVGRSGPQNDLITFDLAGPDDTWLHARGVGGSHVIIRWRTPDAAEDAETVAAAAALAAWYSAARESGAVEVDVARRRHVRKIKGARPGMVTYRNERTVRVQPLAEEGVQGVLGEH